MSLSISGTNWAERNCYSCWLNSWIKLRLRLVCPGNLHRCVRKVTHTPKHQASFLLAGTPPQAGPYGGAEDVPSQHLMRNVSSMSFAGSEQPWMEKRWNLQGRGRLCDLGRVTELLSALVSSSVQLNCEDTEIMHATNIPYWLTQSRCSVNINIFKTCWEKTGVKSLLSGDENQAEFPLGQVRTSWCHRLYYSGFCLEPFYSPS